MSGREELKVIISSHFWKFVIPFVLDLQNNIIWVRLNEEKESLDFAWLRNGNGVTHAAITDLHFYAHGWGEWISQKRNHCLSIFQKAWLLMEHSFQSLINNQICIIWHKLLRIAQAQKRFDEWKITLLLLNMYKRQ